MLLAIKWNNQTIKVLFNFCVFNLLTTLIPTCQFNNSICVLALSSSMVYSSNNQTFTPINSFWYINSVTTLIPTCLFKKFICVLALFNSTAHSSNDPMLNNNNYSITTFKVFIMNVKHFIWFIIITCISCLTQLKN